MLELVAKITAKGRTTVPKAVRDALGVRDGDSIAFRLNDQGGVSLARYEQAGDEAAVDAFLAFLSDDIKRCGPAVVSLLSEAAAKRRRSLVAGADVGPDDDFPDAGPLRPVIGLTSL